MIFAIILFAGALLLLAMRRFASFDKAALQLLGAGLMIALAGYVWQGRPGLAGAPVPPPERQRLGDTEFARTRTTMLGQFDTASRWLTIADSYHRSGATQNAVGVIRAGLKAHPNNNGLWAGLGHALVVHADGVMTPAAELAFARAKRLAPGRAGPRFYYGLALAQGGRFAEAEAVWTELLRSAPEGAQWRPLVADRILMLREIGARQGNPRQP
jgi:cytochrome c-type biogenesis protein CcmH/NrfG